MRRASARLRRRAHRTPYCASSREGRNTTKISLCMPGRTRTYVRGNFIAAWIVARAKAMKGGVRRYYKYLLYYTPLCYKPRSDIRLLLGYYWVIIGLLLGYLADEKQRKAYQRIENDSPTSLTRTLASLV